MRQKRSILKGLAAGMIGGIAATFAMDQFQKAYSATSLQIKQATDPTAAEIQKIEEQFETTDGATARTADRVVRALTGAPLSKHQRATGSSAVHWVFGAAMGAVYGVASEIAPAAKSGLGLGYGTALFLGADEIGVPAFKLGPTAEKVAPEKHATEWVAHLVYGSALELTRRIVRRLL